ncbi:unnamed protein product [Rhizoctonia solani]|uniref:SET domain-containing protein n=1 Tax=Rhizoctonia solani TaxID=456999 RepID=A0A8H3C2W2_9AGAM|nr:unnamed protein product [Rhizoctonia solani]
MGIEQAHQISELFELDAQPGSFNSGLKSLVAFEKGQIMTRLTGAFKVSVNALSTLHCGMGQDEHLELNSILKYINHSCSPNVVIDLSSEDLSEWHFRALKDIAPGDNLTYFYPSTEWDLIQPFDCWCHEQNCLKRIKGSKYLTRAQVEDRGCVNPHIVKLMERRDAD